MAGTDVFYNGVTLKNVVTREFLQKPVRDPSGTDIWYQEFTITVEAIANAALLLDAVQNLGISGVGVGGGAAGQVIQAARQRLAEDRGVFRYIMEGNDILTSGPLTDSNNGPKVLDLKFGNVSSNTVRVLFSIQIAKVDCTENPAPVINNRWSTADDIDEYFRTTRTWTGRLRLSSAIHNPQDFRGMVTPRLAKGWRREKMHFTAAPNALELEYTITDREMLGEGPPSPGVKLSYTHTESLGQAGNLNVGNLTVRIDGARSSDKGLMLTRCAQIVQAKLAVNKLVANNGIFKSLDLTDHGGEGVNAVEARATVLRSPSPASAGAGGLAIALGTILSATLGKPLKDLGLPDYDPDSPATAGPYGTAGDSPAGLAGLFACYLQSPCGGNHEITQVEGQTPEQGNNQAERDGDSPPTTTYSIGELQQEFGSPGYSQDHQEAMYTHATLESHIEYTENRLHLPIAAASDSESDDTAVTVRLSRATARRRIKYSAERTGQPPKLWLPEDFTDSHGIRCKLLSWKPIFQPPQQNSMGTLEYRVDAEYLYGLSRPPRPGEAISVGVLPWDDLASTNYPYPADGFIEPTSENGIN